MTIMPDPGHVVRVVKHRGSLGAGAHRLRGLADLAGVGLVAAEVAMQRWRRAPG
jgi:hypothetical protein